jgi:Zn-dependent protease with chaperone function
LPLHGQLEIGNWQWTSSSVRTRPAATPSSWSSISFLGVTLLIVAVYAAALGIFTGVSSRHHHVYDEQVQHVLWNPQLFLIAAVGTLAVIGLGSGFKTLELAQGGSTVATMLGGRLVAPTTTDPDERKLRNVVEEMAIAAGVPVPQVYLLPQEHGINAFAAGHSTSDAVVAVTAGAVKLLTRDELQGVIGHEFSHILNGDMRLNLRLMGIIFGILCLAVIGRVLLYTRSRSSKDKNPLPLLARLALIVIGWIGVFFGRLIQAAVSRQRELLADASSVQFTRNPAGLAGALKKIGGLSFGSKLEAAHAEEASHMFFGNGMGESFFHLMDTHPPLAERIRAIDPSFDGTFPPVSVRRSGTTSAARCANAAVAPSVPVPRHAPRARGPGRARAAGHCRADHDDQHGQPHLRSPALRRGLRVSIPASLQVAAREGLGASTLVYALLLSDDETTRRKQLDELAAATSTAVCQETSRAAGSANRRHARQAAAGRSRHPRPAPPVARAVPAVPRRRAEAR